MTMHLITDLDEIRRLTEERSAEDSAFRAYVARSLGWSARRLSVLVHEIAEEVTASIDCTRCGACCRELVVNLTPRDIQALAWRLKMTPAEFTQRHATRGERGDQEIAARPCPFLSGTICSVYDDRPETCRSYPHLRKRFRAVGLEDLTHASVCPIVFNVLEELKRRIPGNW